MRITINSVHFKADKKLEQFISEKVQKLTKQYDGITGSDITLKLDNNSETINKITEIRVSVPGKDLYAKKINKTFEEATDSALDALKKQLSKHKEKFSK